MPKKNSCTLYSWPQNPFGHLALLVVDENTEEYFLSLNPNVRPQELHELSFVSATHFTGYPSYMSESVTHENLIRGYYLKNTNNSFLTPTEITDLRNKQKNDKLVADYRETGKPICTEEIDGLDIPSMVEKIKSIKENQETKWCAFSGTDVGFANAYNCASVVWEVLRAGGIEKQLDTQSRSYDLYGLGAGALIAPFTAYSLASVMPAGFFAGRFIEGAIDGKRDIEPMLKIMFEIIKVNPIVKSMLTWTIEPFIVSVAASFSALGIKHPINKLHLTPEIVVKLVQQLKQKMPENHEEHQHALTPS